MRPLLPALLLAALALSACRRAAESESPAALPAVAVSLQTVGTSQASATLAAPATVRPAARAVLAAQVTGSIRALPVIVGQSVPADAVLVEIASPETEARLAQARAQLAEAERVAKREKTLATSGVSTTDSQQDAEARLRLAQASLAEADAQLSHTVIRAPFAGIVTEKQVLPGDLATAGTPLLVLESTQNLRAEGTVPESAARSLHLGDTLAVQTEVNRVVTGRIEKLSAAADPLARTLTIKVALPSGAARSGEFAEILLPLAPATRLLVPASAIRRLGQMEQIFVVAAGHAQLRLVRTGRTVGDAVEILSGLSAGEQIVLNPPTALRDGQPVTAKS